MLHTIVTGTTSGDDDHVIGPRLENVDSETVRCVIQILQLLVSGQELSSHFNLFAGKTFQVVLPQEEKALGW